MLVQQQYDGHLEKNKKPARGLSDFLVKWYFFTISEKKLSEILLNVSMPFFLMLPALIKQTQH